MPMKIYKGGYNLLQSRIKPDADAVRDQSERVVKLVNQNVKLLDGALG